MTTTNARWLRLGEMIQDARDGRGVSQRELAEAVPCSESTIRRLERNPAKAHFGTVARVCEVLELAIFLPGIAEIIEPLAKASEMPVARFGVLSHVKGDMDARAGQIPRTATASQRLT